MARSNQRRLLLWITHRRRPYAHKTTVTFATSGATKSSSDSTATTTVITMHYEREPLGCCNDGVTYVVPTPLV